MGEKMKVFSLNRRLVAAMILAQLLLAAALVIVGTSFSRHYLLSAFDTNLEGHALSVAALVYYRDDGTPGLLFDPAKIPPSTHRVHKDIYLVRSDRLNFERHADGYSPELLNRVPPQTRYWNFKVNGEPYRGIILRDVAILDTEPGEPLPLPKLTVIYAAPTWDITEKMTALATSIALTSLGLLIPILFLAVWSIQRALTPLTDLAFKARSISVRNWQFEPSEQAKSTVELQPLIAAIETVLADLRWAFTRQREFMGDAAHELKTSLAIPKSTLQSLLNKPRHAEEYRRGLALMSQDCERLEALLNRMLRLARVEQWAADGIHRELDLIDLASTCELAIARMAEFAAARHIRITFSLSESVLMRADPGDLELVWMNLLENAVQYSPPGSSVTVLLEAEDVTTTISISDCGCGIPDSDLSQIFNRFYRADRSRSRESGGFGLGLAMAKSIVEAYKGSIHAASKVGHGTTISVRLPTLPTPRKQNQRTVEPSMEDHSSV
jgi:signal transduction histidine kinase